MLVIAPEQSLGSPFYARSNLVDAGARGDETLVVYFTYSNMYLLTPNSQFIPPLPRFVFLINQNP